MSSVDIYGGQKNQRMDPRGQPRQGGAAGGASAAAAAGQQGNNAAGPGGMGKKSNSTSQLSAAGKASEVATYC